MAASDRAASPGKSGQTTGNEALMRASLSAVAPGMALRDGLERILRGNTGGLIVLVVATLLAVEGCRPTHPDRLDTRWEFEPDRPSSDRVCSPTRDADPTCS